MSSRFFLPLAVLMVAICAQAITPWPILINTNNVIIVTNPIYGGVGDGVFTNTTAIQNAINAATLGGITNGLIGGTVELPGPGIYLCGPLTLKKNVNLQVDAGAILRMLPFFKYPTTWVTNGSAYWFTNTADFISGNSLTNIEISGPGAIDGQGLPWWPWANTNNADRPRMISLNSCNHELIQNITLSNSPMFHIAIGGSAKNSTVQGVTVRAPSSSASPPSHNTDACDVSGTNILVQNCDISTGDDNFTCGGGTAYVLLTNNVYGSGHGVSVGSYTDGGVSNIFVINCSFTGTDNGIRLKSERGRGGLIQNLTYCNLTMTNVGWPLLIYSYYEFGLGTLTGVDPTFAANVVATNYTALASSDPIWQNITFSNITAVSSPAGRPPFMIWGLPEAPASNIVFRAVNITSSSTLDPGIFNAVGVQFIDCNFNLPGGVNDMQFFNAGMTFTNTPGNLATTTNLWIFDGLTTNGYGNTLKFYNARATLKNTNAFDDGPLTIAASTFTISNNLTLFPTTVLNFTLSTNATKLAVVGNLSLGGTNTISAGAGFTNGTYSLLTYSGSLSGTLPILGATPANFLYSYDTNTAGQVNLVVALPALPAPTNLIASATNLQINLKWNAVNGASTYNLKRGATSGIYPTLFSGLTATNYTDANVTNGVNYFYVVSDVAGSESTNSLPANAIPLPSNQATNLTAQFSGGQLQLSWPSDHLGWRLQIQTNNLSGGLGTNWATVPNSTNSISAIIPIVTTNDSVFLRLIYP